MRTVATLQTVPVSKTQIHGVPATGAAQVALALVLEILARLQLAPVMRWVVGFYFLFFCFFLYFQKLYIYIYALSCMFHLLAFYE